MKRSGVFLPLLALVLILLPACSQNESPVPAITDPAGAVYHVLNETSPISIDQLINQRSKRG